LLLAISYAQTATSCTFSDGHVVDNGYTGIGYGSEHCNTCACNSGILMCTLFDCPETTAKASASGCTLSGGGLVPDAWSGMDTGANSCNECVCSRGKLMCTLETCITASISPPVPVIVKPITPRTVIDAVMNQPGPDFTKMDKSTCGGKTENTCHGLGTGPCIANPCCKILGGKCLSVAKVVPARFGLECGDFGAPACDDDPACKWNRIEGECEELKEMDCSGLPEEDCDSAQVCSWVLDDLRYVCMETKEVEGIMASGLVTSGLSKVSFKKPLRSTRNSQTSHNFVTGETKTEVRPGWLLITAITFVGIILGCLFATMCSNWLHTKPTELTEDLTQNFPARI